MIGEIRQNFTEASASVGLILATALKENVQKNNKLYKQNNNFARASRFFVHFFARFCNFAWLRHENA